MTITRIFNFQHIQCELGLLFLLFFSTLVHGQEQIPNSETPKIRLLQVDENIFLGILPRHAEIHEVLHDFDVVVDLRYPYEGAYTELAVLKRTAIQYFSIPTSSSFPSPDNVEALEKVISDFPTRKLLIHDMTTTRPNPKVNPGRHLPSSIAYF